ncbi:MAG: DUF1156 domain-containing protein, partial [Moorella sp. (in: Bacteria)]|nr:DUF1156 domain-containing protein [Moorella sp. (in: firmicutes)]
VILDSMAGGGAIPLEGIRYGFKVYANELNPVAAIVLKATLEYPVRFGRGLSSAIRRYAEQVAERVRARLIDFFPLEPAEVWWAEEEERAKRTFRAKNIVSRAPASVDPPKNCYLWMRTVPCPKCGLKIPLCTNFYIVKKKGQPEKDLAVFPVVPHSGEVCAFRFVKPAQFPECRWPGMAPGKHFHPTETPTFKDGKAICPRCGNVLEGEEVKALARAGHLGNQLYGVATQVPVRLTYRNGEEKIRYLWRFRPPNEADLEAVAAAEAELARLRPGWEAQGLIPDERIPEDMEDTRPIEYGMPFWSDMFLPRQLLTNVVILEEIRCVREQAHRELPADQAEAVSVYLAFILSKVVDYNSVNTSWLYGRLSITHTFLRHDFAFRGAFCEFDGARLAVAWAARQV